jgi:hypothetical protein
MILKLKIYVYRALLHRFQRFIKSKYIYYYVDFILSESEYDPKHFPVLPYIPEEERPPSMHMKLDRRCKLPFVERIMDWFYEGTGAYVVKDYFRNNDFYFAQRLPGSIITALKNDKNMQDET